MMEDFHKKRPHNLHSGDRHHFCKAIRLVYKLRSDRGPVHISPVYTANYMDSMLIVHVCKWMFAEFLRLAWNADKDIVAATIEQIVQLEHALIHELDGKPLVLARGIGAAEEVMLLLSHAVGNRLSRAQIREYARLQKPSTLNAAIAKLIVLREARVDDQGLISLTPKGQVRVMTEVIPAERPR